MSIELVVGLGNHGRKYTMSRHNVGYLVAEKLADRHADQRWLKAKLCEVVSAHLGPRLVLAKPLTFMNRSGRAIEWLLELMEIEPRQMLVAVDDVDLPLGTLRLRRSGGPGTHNGLRDICSRVGTSFPRLRLGVRGIEPWEDLAAYVLSPFAESEIRLVPAVVKRAADAVEAVVRHGIDQAMNEYNRKIEDPKPDVGT
jgi:PTH1 family peptidyl-tRNA hydrolase